MRIKKKRCPFCGGEAMLEAHTGKYGDFAYIQCVMCGSRGKSISGAKYANTDDEIQEMFDKALAAWNTRVGDEDNDD